MEACSRRKKVEMLFAHLAAAATPGAVPDERLTSGPDYNPYDPISYAQHNTGRGGGR